MTPSFRLSIPEPCTQNWDDMLPDERGRFCLTCQKTVVDFTIMSDAQLARFFHNHKGAVCGRIAEDQAHRQITMPDESIVMSPKITVRIAASLLGFHLLAASAAAQRKPAPLTPSQLRELPIPVSPRTVTAFVLKDKVPQPNFTVIVQPVGTMICTDENGRFSFRIPDSVAMHTIRFDLAENAGLGNNDGIVDANLMQYRSMQSPAAEDEEEPTPSAWLPIEIVIATSRPRHRYGGEVAVHYTEATPVRKSRWTRFKGLFKRGEK